MQISFWFWSEQCLSIFNPSNLVPDEFEKNFIPAKFWKNLEPPNKIPAKISSLKACVCYFHQFFIFSLNDSPFTKWYPLEIFEKCFWFHLKSFFRSWDIHIFVLLSFPLFLPVGHGFRRWSKINFKVHDLMICLNKNSIKHCLISWEVKKVWHWNFAHRWSIR